MPENRVKGLRRFSKIHRIHQDPKVWGSYLFLSTILTRFERSQEECIMFWHNSCAYNTAEGSIVF